MTEKEPWRGVADMIQEVDVEATSLEHPDEETDELLDEIPPGMNYQYFTEKMNHPSPQFEWRSKYSDYLRKAHPEEPVKTIVAQPGHRTGPYHWNGRRFHTNELLRIQTFPSSFELPDVKTVSRKLVGNAVPVKLAQSVIEAAVEGDGVRSGKLPSPRRGRTSHQTYRRRCEDRLVELYGVEVLDD